MSVLTELLDFFKYDPERDKASTFNIQLALNDNWDKIRTFAERVAASDLSNVDKAALAAAIATAVSSGALKPGDVGADPAGAAQVVQGNLQTHMADKSNPHKVLPVQVGGIPIVTTYTPEGGVDGVDYACDVPGVTEYSAALRLCVRFHARSASVSPKLSVNGLGAKQIMQPDQMFVSSLSLLTVGFIAPDAQIDLIMDADSTKWLIISAMITPVSCGGTGLRTIPERSFLVGSKANVNSLSSLPPNSVRAVIGASKPVWAEVTFPAAGWTLEGGVYVQTVACSAAKAEMKGYPNVGLKKSTDAAARELEKEAYALIEYVDTLDGSVKATCGDKAPQVAITLLFSGGVA